MSRISSKIDQIKPSATIMVGMKAMNLKAQGKDIVSLGFGEPDFDTPEHIRDAAIAAIRAGKTRYTQVDGTPELKAAIIRKLSLENELGFEPDQIIVSNGAKQSLYNLMVAVLNHGDEVIVPAPYWVSYPDMVKLADAEPAILAASPEKNFKITARELQNTLNENTRMVILNSPSNPTGKVYTEQEYRTLGDVLVEHPKVFIACDDIYEHIYWGGSPYRTFLNACPELADRTAVINGVSKAYAMTGWRIGYAANTELAPAFTRWVTNTDSCPPHPNQWAVVEALSGPQDAALEMRDVFLQRRDRIVKGLNDLEGWNCLTPGGAFYVWPNVTEACRLVGAENSEDLRKKLLYDAGVAVLADIHFGQQVEGDGEHVRFSYASSFEAIDDGLSRIADFMKKNKR